MAVPCYETKAFPLVVAAEGGSRGDNRSKLRATRTVVPAPNGANQGQARRVWRYHEGSHPRPSVSPDEGNHTAQTEMKPHRRPVSADLERTGRFRRPRIKSPSNSPVVNPATASTFLTTLSSPPSW